MTKPYYEENEITIYHGDCREVARDLSFDVVITDPVYPKLDYGWAYVPIEDLAFTCRQFYFWMSLESFPLVPTALHVWSKANVYIGNSEQFELIYEVNGQRVGSVLRESAINCPMNAQMNGDVFYQHPCQKPIKLMCRLLNKTEGLVLDPFMGSGTTLRAAKNCGRRAVGIEINERYCEMAANRLRQEVLQFS